jgi:uncharacterized protein YkwD
VRFPRLGTAALLAALVTLVGLVLVPAQAAPAPAARAYERTAHAWTNVKRDAHHRAPLARHGCLDRMARAHAARMARRKQIFHQDLGTVQRECGMGWVGENVAYGYPTGRDVVRAWMRSPGHRANILRRQFRREGLGAVRVNGVWYVAQVFGTPA